MFDFQYFIQYSWASFIRTLLLRTSLYPNRYLREPIFYMKICLVYPELALRIRTPLLGTDHNNYSIIRKYKTKNFRFRQ